MPAMELRLQRFIAAVQVVSDIDNLNAESPVVLRFYEPVQDITVSVICSIEEPTNMIIPVNAIWIVFDKDSPYYLQALQRVSKQPSSGFDFTWKRLYFYDDVFTEQTYDPEDLGGVSTEPVGPATNDIMGLVALSLPSDTPSNPSVISEGHNSLTNNRAPKDHSHDPKAAEALTSNQTLGIAIADQASPALGMTLVVGNGVAEWRHLTESDLDMEM